MRDPFTVCGDCSIMFVKPLDRIPTCPKCGIDVEMPGYNADTREYSFDCSPRKPYAPEVH